MKLEFIDHNTYKESDFEAIFDDLHNDLYRKYGKIIHANSYIKIDTISLPDMYDKIEINCDQMTLIVWKIFL